MNKNSFFEESNRSHYHCLKCVDRSLEFKSPEEFLHNNSEKEVFKQITSLLGCSDKERFHYCGECKTVYPRFYYSHDIVKEKQPFRCEQCGYALQTLGIVDECSIDDKIFYCFECARRKDDVDLYGFFYDDSLENRYFIPLSPEQVKARFQFLENSEEDPNDYHYLAQSFEHDPDYVLNIVGEGPDSLVFKKAVVYANNYIVEPPDEGTVVNDAVDGSTENLDDNLIQEYVPDYPPCPDRSMFDTIVVEPDHIYLKTKIDRSKVKRGIGLALFVFLFCMTSLVTYQDLPYPAPTYLSAVFVIGAVCSFLLLTCLFLINWFDLFDYTEIHCEDGNLIVKASDKLNCDKWSFTAIKKIEFAQLNRKTNQMKSVPITKEIKTSSKKSSKVSIIGVYIYQYRKRFLVRLPYNIRTIRWIASVILECCYGQRIIQVHASSNE